MNSAEFIKKTGKFVKLFAKCGSLNVQIINNFKNIIFIACKRSKICKYDVNSMVIICSTCQMEEKECTWVKYLIYTVLSHFQICPYLRVFSPPNIYSQNFRVHQKMFFSKSEFGVSVRRQYQAQCTHFFCEVQQTHDIHST